MKKKIFIEGMGCEYCAGKVTKNLVGISGVKVVELNFAEKSALVDTLEEVTNEQLEEAVHGADCEVLEIKNL